jgi:hypothetical protein
MPTTTETLLANAGPSCKPGEDHSAYWIPTLLENGKAVEPHGVTVYYGSRLEDPTATVPFPQGFRMIAGDAKRQIDTPKGAPDHKSHVGPAGPDGTCASGKFPVAIPSISFVIGYPTSDGAAGFELSSGNASSMHGDAFLAWDDAPLGHRVKDCIVRHAKCDTAGTF